MQTTNVLAVCYVLSCIKVLQGLRCYSCNDVESEDDCNWQTERCSIDQGACFTEIRNFGNSVRLKKSCYQKHACRNLHQQIGHECPRVCTLCCTGELCNTAAPKACSCNLATEAPRRTKPTVKTPVLKRWRNRARQIRRQRNRMRKMKKTSTTATTIITDMSSQSTVKTSPVILQSLANNIKVDSTRSGKKSNSVTSPTLYKSSIMSYLSNKANMSRRPTFTTSTAITTASGARASSTHHNTRQLSTIEFHGATTAVASTSKVQHDSEGSNLNSRQPHSSFKVRTPTAFEMTTKPRLVATTSYSTTEGNTESTAFFANAKTQGRHTKSTLSTATQGPFTQAILSTTSNSSSAFVGTANSPIQSLNAGISTSFEPEASDTTQHDDRSDIYQHTTAVSATMSFESIEESTHLDPEATETTRHEGKSGVYQDSAPMTGTQSIEASTRSEYEVTETTQYRSKSDAYQYSTQVSATRSYESMKESTPSYPEATDTTLLESKSDMYEESTPISVTPSYESMKESTPLDFEVAETTQLDRDSDLYSDSTSMAATQSYESIEASSPSEYEARETTQYPNKQDVYQDSTQVSATQSYESKKEGKPFVPEATETTQHGGETDMYQNSTQVSATRSYESMKESTPFVPDAMDSIQHGGKSDMYQNSTQVSAAHSYESIEASTPSEYENTQITKHDNNSHMNQDSTPMASTQSRESMEASTSSEYEARETIQYSNKQDIYQDSTRSSATQSHTSFKENTHLDSEATETTQHEGESDMYQGATPNASTQSYESIETSTPSKYEISQTSKHDDNSHVYQVVTTQDSATSSIVSVKTSTPIGSATTATAQGGGKRAFYNVSMELATQANDEPVTLPHSVTPFQSSVNLGTSNSTAPDKVTTSLAEDAFLTTRDINPNQASELTLAPPCDRKTFVPIQRNNTNLMSCRRSANTNMAMICSVDFDISTPRPFEEFSLFIDKNGSATEFAYHQCRTHEQGDPTVAESPRILCINMTNKRNIVRFRRKQLLPRVIRENDSNYNLDCEFKYFATLKATNGGFNSRNASVEGSVFPFEFKAVKRLQTFCGKRLFGIHCDFSPEPTTAPGKVKAGSIPWTTPVIIVAVVVSVILGIVIILGLVRKKGFYLVRRKVKPNKKDDK